MIGKRKQQYSRPSDEVDEVSTTNEIVGKEIAKLRACAERWHVIETLMMIGDVELTQAEGGGFRISVEPVENIMAISWEGNTPEQVADNVISTSSLW